MSLKHISTSITLLLWIGTSSFAVNRAASDELFRKTVTFAGQAWDVKSSGENRWGPGPNRFSDSRDNVWVDTQGRLHLRITKQGGEWQCAEVALHKSLGYGHYLFRIQKLDRPLDRNIVLGLFTWSDDPAYEHREIDIEMARWGDPKADNLQNVVQPYTKPDRMNRYVFPLHQESTTHGFEWTPDLIHFESQSQSKATKRDWTFRGKDRPKPGDEKARINLWLFQGRAPHDGKEVEVVIESFEYRPLSP